MKRFCLFLCIVYMYMHCISSFSCQYKYLFSLKKRGINDCLSLSATTYNIRQTYTITCIYRYILRILINHLKEKYLFKIFLSLKCMLCVYCRKLRDADEQNRELMASVAKREEGLHQNNVRDFFVWVFFY